LATGVQRSGAEPPRSIFSHAVSLVVPSSKHGGIERRTHSHDGVRRHHLYDGAMTKELAAKLGTMTGPVHGFIYFAEEATEEYEAAGLPAVSHYFGSRAAPFGAVSAEVVIAAFYNFKPSAVRAAIPTAWESAAPEVIQQARMTAAGRALAPHATRVPGGDIAEAIEIATRIVEGVGYEGRPLAAANMTVPTHDDPVTHLWQLTTIIREWRGDAHIGVLIEADIDAVEALALHVGIGAFPRAIAQATRRWNDEEWEAGVERLASRGLMNDDGSTTEAGSEFRAAIEVRTDKLCDRQIATVGEDASRRLIELLRPLRKGLTDEGRFSRPPRT
jgi:hypothetical protein